MRRSSASRSARRPAARLVGADALGGPEICTPPRRGDPCGRPQSRNPPCHCEPVTDAPGAAIRPSSPYSTTVKPGEAALRLRGRRRSRMYSFRGSFANRRSVTQRASSDDVGDGALDVPEARGKCPLRRRGDLYGRPRGETIMQKKSPANPYPAWSGFAVLIFGKWSILCAGAS